MVCPRWWLKTGVRSSLVGDDYFDGVTFVERPPVLVQGRRGPWRVGKFGLDANGDRAILLNDEGVRFIEATDNVTLSTIMPVAPTPELLKLYPSNNGADELMLVQVTRFVCGSLVVAIAGNHLVSDGYGRCSFMMAWGHATRCIAVPPHDRTSSSIVFTPRNPARIEFEHRGVEFKQARCCDTLDNMEQHASAGGGGDKVIVRRVHFSAEMVSELKALASSPIKCMVSHLWRCISKARGLDRETPTTLKIAVNGRRRMCHPETCPTTTVGELLAKPLWHVAELVSREVAKVDDSYFRSFIDFASSGVVEEEGLVPAADPTKMVHCPDVEVYSQVGIPIYDVDFGAGRPFLYMPGYLPEEGLVFIVPSSSGNGSIDAKVCLFSGAMDIFKNCCYSISGSS
ncbi:hypothetical protein HU200_034627 [Digitaria exilis]|uniref:Uncharacterized protein n=1 Tax=Digitaria exilis TaxID=1010633 RepID=A0A835EM46_9POAL|nr:hypothetical protein HU200_034627 [Digitaria exilis]